MEGINIEIPSKKIIQGCVIDKRISMIKFQTRTFDAGY
jgi:hypothetical protein